MEMNFRNLVEVLGIDAPVHFTPKDKLDKQNYVFCKFMGDDETAAIIVGNHDPNVHYDNSDLGLHFPDLSLEEYYELEKARNPVGISNHICEVSSQMKVNIDDIPIMFAVHCVLHEYGHWIYFKKTGLTSYQYCEQEKKNANHMKTWQEKFMKCQIGIHTNVIWLKDMTKRYIRNSHLKLLQTNTHWSI